MNPSPFDSPDADVALQTDDGTSFRVSSRILSEASPFFRDLFTLPQPAADKDVSPAVIHVTECSEVMHTLLRFVYPIEDPPVETLSLLDDVLGAALKYDMGLAAQSLQRLLVSPKSVEKEPFRVYAFACRHGLDEEANIASGHTLTMNILDTPLTEEFKFIKASEYRELLILHRSRGMAAQNLLGGCPTIRCPGCRKVYPPKWWIDWSTRAKEELRQRPTTNVIFSHAFLVKSAKSVNFSRAWCQDCRASILKSTFLLFLKKCIDDLPSTIRGHIARPKMSYELQLS